MNSQTRKIVSTTTIATLAAFSLTACGKGSSTAASSGSDRLVWQNSPVMFDTTGGIGRDMNSSSYNSGASAQAVSVPLAMNQIASLTPPSVNGSPLQANAILYSTLLTNKAYVAYNTQGAATAGGIDVIDFSTPSAPVMSSQAVYPNIDINGIYVTLTDLYAVGADNSDYPAHLYDFTLASGGNITTTPSRTVQLPGYTGTAVTGDVLNIYAATGDNGGLTILPKTTLTSQSYTSISDVRDLSVDATGVNVLVGATSSAAKINRYSLLGILNSSSASLAAQSSADGGKASLQAGTLLNLATAGVSGTNLVCGATGAIALNIPIPTAAQFPNLTPDLRAANSATFGGGLIYVANGAAGISVYTMELGSVTASCNVTTTYVGRILFPDGVSVNNVVYNAGKLIVATGLGGFRIIQVTQGVAVGGLGLQLTL